MKKSGILSAIAVAFLLAACGSDPAATPDPTVVETTDAPTATLAGTTAPIRAPIAACVVTNIPRYSSTLEPR